MWQVPHRGVMVIKCFRSVRPLLGLTLKTGRLAGVPRLPSRAALLLSAGRTLPCFPPSTRAPDPSNDHAASYLRAFPRVVPAASSLYHPLDQTLRVSSLTQGTLSTPRPLLQPGPCSAHLLPPTALLGGGWPSSGLVAVSRPPNLCGCFCRVLLLTCPGC